MAAPLTATTSAPPAKKPLVLVIDAEIGAGKSTLLDVLSERLHLPGKKIKFIYEPVDDWKSSGVLDWFYSDIPANSYKFQTYTFVTRVERCRAAYDPDVDVYICERSIFSDRYFFVQMLYDDKAITEMEWQMYNRWWDMWKLVMPFEPTAFIYLKTELDAMMDRIVKRNRGAETTIPKEYQAKLRRYHEQFFGKTEFPVYTIDGMINYLEEPGKVEVMDRFYAIMREIEEQSKENQENLQQLELQSPSPSPSPQQPQPPRKQHSSPLAEKSPSSSPLSSPVGHKSKQMHAADESMMMMGVEGEDGEMVLVGGGGVEVRSSTAKRLRAVPQPQDA